MRTSHGIVFTALFVAASCAGAVTFTTDPEEVVFNKASDSATVKVWADGAPVPASDIRSFHLMVGSSDYGHMFRFSKADGAVTLTPSPTVEVGSYDLRIATAKGDAWVKVYTPLGENKTSLQSLANKLNMPLDDLKRQTGMAQQRRVRGGVGMSLPPVYPVGRTLTLDMGTAPNVKARWEVDKKVISEGLGAGNLVYLFKEPGPHLFTYTEFDGDAVSGQASDIVEGAENPANDVSVDVHTKLTLAAPTGYGKHTWTVNGEAADGDENIEIKRDAPCELVVKVLSEKPVQGRPEEFDRTTYRVKVTPKQK